MTKKAIILFTVTAVLCVNIYAQSRSAQEYLNSGNTHFSNNNYDQALMDYSEAIRLNPGYAIAYHNRGNVYNVINDYDRAIADYSEAIRLNPGSANTYFSRASVYARRGDHNLAITDYTAALRIDPNHENARNGLVRAQTALGQRPDERLQPVSENIFAVETAQSTTQQQWQEYEQHEDGIAFFDDQEPQNNFFSFGATSLITFSDDTFLLGPGLALSWNNPKLFGFLGIGTYLNVVVPMIKDDIGFEMGYAASLLAGPSYMIFDNGVFALPVTAGFHISVATPNDFGIFMYNFGAGLSLDFFWRFNEKWHAYARVLAAYNFMEGGEFLGFPSLGVGFSF